MKSSSWNCTVLGLGLLVGFIVHRGECAVWYVDPSAQGDRSGTSWENACLTISEVIAKIRRNAEVWVAAGHYSETVVMKPRVALYGGFAGRETTREERDWETNKTIIDGSGIDAPVVTGANADIDGFTITGGNQGGIHCYSSSTSINNCIIERNNGIGINCYNSSTMHISYTSIVNNYGGGIVCEAGTSASILNCVISGNTAENGAGIRCGTSTTLKIQNSTISGNKAAKYGGGIYSDNPGSEYYGFVQSSVVITNTILADNSAIRGGGYYCGYYSTVSLINSVVCRNSADQGGAGIYESSPATIINCTVVGNSNGIFNYCEHLIITNSILWNIGLEIYDWVYRQAVVTYSCVQGGWPGEGNINSYPQFVNPIQGDYHLQNGSPCIDRGLVSNVYSPDIDGKNRPGEDGLLDMGAYESSPEYEPQSVVSLPRLYVHADAPSGGDGTSWDRALNSIGSAWLFVDVPYEIWVAAGTYRESVKPDSGMRLYGGFVGNETSLEERNWEINQTIIDASGLNASTVIIETEHVVVDGFTITGGAASGVYCFSASPTVSNCTLPHNTVAGLYCYLSSPILERCIISENSSSGDGGGIFCYYSNPHFKDCAIVNNTAANGGGVYNYSKIINCVIARNRAKRGGGLCIIFGNQLHNCLLTNNFAENGGAVYEINSIVHYQNCIFFDNRATLKNVFSLNGIYDEYSLAFLINSIVWDSELDAPISENDNITSSFSCIKGGWSRPGDFDNIGNDPQFVDPAQGNFHLQDGSPCIDAGDYDSSFNDACLPPGLGTARNDMGISGGPYNCSRTIEEPTTAVEAFVLY